MRSMVDGSLQMKSFLQGRPVLLLGLNEDLVVKGMDEKPKQTTPGVGSGLELEDVVLHECVDMQKFEDEKVLAYVRTCIVYADL